MPRPILALMGSGHRPTSDRADEWHAAPPRKNRRITRAPAEPKDDRAFAPASPTVLFAAGVYSTRITRPRLRASTWAIAGYSYPCEEVTLYLVGPVRSRWCSRRSLLRVILAAIAEKTLTRCHGSSSGSSRELTIISDAYIAPWPAKVKPLPVAAVTCPG